MKIIHSIFISVFILTIILPIVLFSLNKDPIQFNIYENRRLSSFPNFNNFNQFNYELESYINDNIPLRTLYISLYHYLFGWNLYAPVTPYIRGKYNNIFRIEEIIKQIGINNAPKFDYNEIINGMNFIAKKHNAKFIFLLVPDKESVMFDYLPNWIVQFKKYHQSYSLREILVRQLDKNNFVFIDLYNDMITQKSFLFNKRYDINHWNGNGLLLALHKINNFIDISQLEFSKHIKLEQYSYNVFPYLGQYSIEKVPRLVHFGEISNIKYIDYDKRNRWTGTDYTKNEFRDINSMALFSDSSLKNKFIFENKNIPSKTNMTPYIYLFNQHIQPFNKNYISYDFYKNVIKDIKANYIIYQITERTLDEKGFPNDPVFKILGRYALKKNENFVFPENIINKTNKEIADIELQVEKNTYFGISRKFKTNKNGEIYISFRYLAPKKTTATLEYSLDKDFSNIKKITANIGGGNDAVTFHIKSQPNKPIYARLSPGRVNGKYKFLEIPELREKMYNGF